MRLHIQVEGLEQTRTAMAEAMRRFEKALEAGLAQGGKIVEGEAKALCPVSTEATRPGGPHGELRASITSRAEGLECEVGTNKEYAMYVEFGTYKMAAQPYLMPALKNKQAEIINAIKARLAR